MSGSSSSNKYRGVRSRKWGKWVAEVKEPGTTKRIWLGSYRSAEEAAHAYDAGLLCVRGNPNKLNFPNDRPTLPPGTPGNYTTLEVQGAAQMAAAAYSGRRFSFSEWMRSRGADQDDNTPQAGGDSFDFPTPPPYDPPSDDDGPGGNYDDINNLWNHDR